MRQAGRKAQIAGSGTHCAAPKGRGAGNVMQVPFPFRHFPLRRMQDAKSVMQTTEAMLQIAESVAHFALGGMQIAGGVMQSADNVKPPLRDGFS